MEDSQGKHIAGVSVGQRSASNKRECFKNEYWHEGFCCDKCAPGYKLIKKCSSGIMSQCKKCTEGTYQNKMNYFPNCFRCQKCNKRKHAVIISSCTYQNNTVCGCQPGYRMWLFDSFTWDCVLPKNRVSGQARFQH
ncbi:tumor necrosis factor receptor superfamily member 14-like isoform X2 [Myxocyprinus asiaticus]|uniref:tumor necrosis factor receptor superfamily member 14-like isoform X2 n=1 Tax=Myxocyprinus asiaticus TaxID=70543 RepID=UPI002223CEA8|nr:tumor necrosis factor receptor superfamily member 14-like isoform X2 [Myxocyprinus asiaticus]